MKSSLASVLFANVKKLILIQNSPRHSMPLWGEGMVFKLPTRSPESRDDWGERTQVPGANQRFESKGKIRAQGQAIHLGEAMWRSPCTAVGQTHGVWLRDLKWLLGHSQGYQLPQG